MGVLAAERIKLTSTKSPWWCSLIVVGLSIGFAALLALVTRNVPENEGGPPLTVDVATVGVSGFGVMVLMIMAALTVTSEYRFGLIRTTFQAVPNRTKVLLTKTGLIGAYAVLLATVLAFAAFAVAKAIGGPEASEQLVLEGNWRMILSIPIYTLLCVMIAIGVGALVRQSAAAISLIVLWILLIEPLVGVLGSVGREINAFLPFANANRFMAAPDVPSEDWHWGVWGSLIYFIVFTLVVYGVALVVTNKRDA